MTEKNTFEPSKKTEKSKVIFIGIVIVILAILNGLLYFEYTNTKDSLAETLQIKKALKQELAEAKVQFKEYEGKISDLDEMVFSLNSDLEKKGVFIEELLSDKKITANQLKKARKELNLLKQLKIQYLARIDSLYQSNQELIAENLILQGDLDESSFRNQSLTSENIDLANKVAIGSVLRTTNLSSAGIKIKSNKEKVATKAKKTEKIRVCVTILENKVVSTGIKTIFIKVLGPRGTVLSHNADANDTFIAEGQPNIYTIKEQIDYNNEEKDLCLYWDKGSEYEVGQYIIQLYENGHLIGKSGFELK
ncbi:MAG: hypothetical protein COC01_05940 [Bacteroidetes bacterium]|nr:MAG: hypothetical protein COC01_05940 [Bacteroidota bacterium]